MAEVINLNRFRKQKARADKRAAADANAVKFGRPKAQRAQEEAEAARARALLDGRRIAPPADGRTDPDDDGPEDGAP